jgi:hypothetical protein
MSYEKTKALWRKCSLDAIKRMIFQDDAGFRYTLFRIMKVVTVVGDRHEIKIGDKITIFRFSEEAPNQFEKLSYEVEVITINQRLGIMELQSFVELCAFREQPALYFPVLAQEYFQARIPLGSHLPCFEKGVISKCDTSTQLGSTQSDIEGAVGCGLFAADEHTLIGICLRYEKDPEEQAAAIGERNLSSYTTHIAPVFSFF